MRDVVREIGDRGRDTARWKLEKRDRSAFPGRGGKREKKGRRQADIVYNQGSCSCHPLACRLMTVFILGYRPL